MIERPDPVAQPNAIMRQWRDGTWNESFNVFTTTEGIALVLLLEDDSPPVDGTPGYAPSCGIINLGAATLEDRFLINNGTVLSCAFVPLTSGIAADLTALDARVTAEELLSVSFDSRLDTAEADLAASTGTGDLVRESGPTLDVPVIPDLTAAQHDHTNAAGGGQLTDAALSAAVTVPKGGTGLSSATPYAVLCGGTGATTAFQSIASVGAAGEVLTSNGAGALPTFQPAGGGAVGGADTQILFNNVGVEDGNPNFLIIDASDLAKFGSSAGTRGRVNIAAANGTYGFSTMVDNGGRGFECTTTDFNGTTTGTHLSMSLGAQTGNTTVLLNARTAGSSATGTMSLQNLGGFLGIGVTPPLVYTHIQSNDTSVTSGEHHMLFVVRNATRSGFLMGYRADGANDTGCYIRSANLSTAFLSLGTASTAQILHMISTGQCGVQVLSPTAILHLKAGTTAASSAPLKFNSGTSMTAAEAGAMEFTTDDLFFTITTGPARKRVLMADAVGGLTANTYPVATTNGRLADSGFTTTNLVSGVHTPTRSAEVNMDANVTPFECQYMRVGNTVTVSGRFTADPTLTATATSFEFSLPIASNIGAVEDLSGVAFCGAIAAMGAAISGSVANNTAVFSWISTDVTSQSWSFTYSYQVI